MYVGYNGLFYVREGIEQVEEKLCVSFLNSLQRKSHCKFQEFHCNYSEF